MPATGFRLLATAVIAIHLAWILWVIFGWVFTRRRPWLRGFHILSLVYGILVESFPFPCPLTLAEDWCDRRAGITPYRQTFLIHFLGRLVYPNVSQALITWTAVPVCVFIMGIYVARFRRRTPEGW
jgi:hypothetical protein